jgi:hypothetical protein
VLSKHSTWGFTGSDKGIPPKLSGIILYDGLLIDPDIDVAVARRGDYPTRESLLIQAQPLRHYLFLNLLDDPLVVFSFDASLSPSNDIPWLYSARRDVSFPPIKGDMTMAHHLASLTAGIGKVQAIDHVIKPHLQNLEQVLSSDSGTPLRLSEVLAELLLQHPISVPSPLLFL